MAGPDTERGDKGAAGLHADWARMSTATLCIEQEDKLTACLLYTSPSPRD